MERIIIHLAVDAFAADNTPQLLADIDNAIVHAVADHFHCSCTLLRDLSCGATMQVEHISPPADSDFWELCRAVKRRVDEAVSHFITTLEVREFGAVVDEGSVYSSATIETVEASQAPVTASPAKKNADSEATIEIDTTGPTALLANDLARMAFEMIGCHTCLYRNGRLVLEGILEKRDDYGTVVADAVTHAHRLARRLMVAWGRTFNYRVVRVY